jgi:hypothetical protein
MFFFKKLYLFISFFILFIEFFLDDIYFLVILYAFNFRRDFFNSFKFFLSFA